MTLPRSSSRPTSDRLHVGPLLLAVLAITACDPGDIKEKLFEGHGDHSGGSGGGGTDYNPCAATLCLAGARCEVQPVQCLKAPCPVQAVCVKDPPKDCVQNVACIKGATFDSSPGVCACVPPVVDPPPPPACGPVCAIACEHGNVLDGKGCPTCACNPPPIDPCATVRCAAGTHCESNPVQCVKAPCPATASCVPDAPVVRCGGIAGTRCPGGGKCADDPADSCDPNAGGADCGGICQCLQNALCIRGAVFDSSPKVCACVPATPPPPPTCGPVCQIFCEHGNVLDASGCPTCRCNPAPVACPPEKCTGPGPKAPTRMCSDGSTAGPACVPSSNGGCGWTVTKCPA